MKKTYMTPSQKIAELDMVAMIAESITTHDEEGYNEEDYEGGYVKGEKGNLWDSLW